MKKRSLLGIFFVLFLGVNLLGQTTSWYVPMFNNNPPNLMNSEIRQNDYKIGIGIGSSTTPLAKLHVNGSIFLPNIESIWFKSTSSNSESLRIWQEWNTSRIDYNPKLNIRGSEVRFSNYNNANTKVIIQSLSNVNYNQWSSHPFTITTGNSTGDFSLCMGVDKTNKCTYISSFNMSLGGGNLTLNPLGGTVSIGTVYSQGYKLAVAGKIIAEEIVVSLRAQWPDYVFDENYDLKSLYEVEQYINEHKYLPNIPSAKEIEENGISIGEMNCILLEKIEELTLYTVNQQNLIDELINKINRLEEIVK